MTKRILLVASLFLLIILLAAAACSANPQKPAGLLTPPTSTPAPTSRVWPTGTAATSVYVPEPTTTKPAPTAAPTKPAGPRTSFGEGVWEVGVDIAAGKYKTTGSDGYGCYYARLKTGDGSLGDIIDNNDTDGPATVTIKSSDGYFDTSGCAAWSKVS